MMRMAPLRAASSAVASTTSSAASSSRSVLASNSGMASRRCLQTSAKLSQASPAEPPKMIKLQVNGRDVEVEQGTALIQACEKAGAQIPRFCYHERLQIAGNCRMCLVTSQGAPKPVASCAMPAAPGMKIFTEDEKTKTARANVMEFLLANHPLDCPICDWGGECDLQDQSMRYGSDRGRFHEIAGKRAVEDKNLGPLVKTIMTRCIHCTRCVRFSNDVAGVQEMGTSGRGNDLQIGTYIEKVIDSEMSGNIIDLCPVGALTSKPYAFTTRPWELKKTESIDVLDAVGSNIRVDSRGVQVMRVLPRTNDDVNEEWINDKTRFAVDGLKYQRLTTPLIKQGDRFVPASWPEALATVAEGLAASGAKGDEIQGVAGALADAESLVALKDLINSLGSENVTVDLPAGQLPPASGVDVRSNYQFNSTIAGIEEADALLLIGTNPRHEAAIINTRIRKAYLHKGLDVGLIGEKVDTTYEYEHVGSDASAIADVLAGKGNFGKRLKEAKKPMIVIGSSVLEHVDGAAALSEVAKAVQADKRYLSEEYTGFGILQRTASRVASLDVGYSPSQQASKTSPKFVYLLGADDFANAEDRIPRDAFVVYQGHHGDVGAQYASVILPSSCYTEHSLTYTNTEGRNQITRAAVPPPGASREGWKCIRALSEVLGSPLPYDDILSVRDRMFDISPTLTRYDQREATSAATALLGLKDLQAKAKGKKITGAPLLNPIQNFYQTDAVSRSSPTMAKCVDAFINKIGDEGRPGAELASFS
ncbi:nadh-ubiquinone oxidoreductase [Ceraceosorus bombacis]|uniref:NADH-ubiquinone oxidoreductase 78 kDa subunit, mitochondrial n=1 Tax=Ceraceosorus bombacis TaxID=401625 RepID=A0A0P1BNC6_9BASI|nr:nadh-ubiquinone oxidoreductase [Ceraceosorus bombacis]